MKHPIIGVMGSGREEHRERAEALGALLATKRVHLLTGGGEGVMAAVSRGFARTQPRYGAVIGILPANDACDAPRTGYPNPWVEIPIVTHLPLSGRKGTDSQSRNPINILSSAAVIALPGSHGTASEVRLAVRHGRPVVAHVASRIDIPGLDADELREAVPLVKTLEEVEAFVDRIVG